MNEAIQIAQRKADKSAEQNRNQFNRKFHGNDIITRDRVLYKTFWREEALANCELTGKTQFMKL